MPAEVIEMDATSEFSVFSTPRAKGGFYIYVFGQSRSTKQNLVKIFLVKRTVSVH